MQPISFEQLALRLPEFVARIRGETGVPGIAVAASVRGRRVYARAGTHAVDGEQPLAIDDHFHIGCTAKLLLAVIALELGRDATLDLQAPIARYLPELTDTVHGPSVRVAHLLSHTAGYLGTNILDPLVQALDWHGLVDYLRQAPQLFPPGAVFSYEHTESVLLGEILQRATGRPGLELVRERLLEPLGITAGVLGAYPDRTRYAGQHELDPVARRYVRLDDLGRVSELWLPAFSNFTLSLPDLMTITEAICGVQSRAPIAVATVHRLRQAVVRLPPSAGGPLRELLPVAYGLGTARLRDGFCGNGGVTRGQCLALRFDPPSGVCVAVGLNAQLSYLRDFIIAAVCRDLSGVETDSAPQPFGLDLGDLPGLYRGPGAGTVRVTLERERLICAIGRDGIDQQLTAELVLGADGAPSLRSPIPQLSLGFFREPASRQLGLLLGLTAYKRFDA